ncbi:hypothetical protein FKM82_027457, partial [Ascaphus truei]
ESEFAKSTMRLAESTRTNLIQQPCMPLQDVYLLLMDHDTQTGNSALETAAQLQMKKYFQVTQCIQGLSVIPIHSIYRAS